MVLLMVTGSGCETFKTRFGPTYTPQSVNAAKKQYRMDYSNRQLTTLPPPITGNRNLRMLDLSGNPQLDWQKTLDDLCRENPRLTTLLLADNNLSSLPEAIRGCTSLTHLSLADNPGLDLASALHHLQPMRIEFLNLAGNQLRVLPETLTGLRHLKDLRLSRNRLQGEENLTVLGRLPELFSLWLDDNDITTLPASIGALTQVRYLFLDHNRLQTLPHSVTLMSRLRVVHLNHNRFRHVPAELTQVPGVMVLFIAANEISELNPDFVERRHHLNGIVLDQNRLSPAQVKQAEKLFSGYFLFSADSQNAATPEL